MPLAQFYKIINCLIDTCSRTGDRMRTLVVGSEKDATGHARSEQRSAQDCVESHVLEAGQMVCPRAERARHQGMEVIEFGGK